MDIFDNLGDFDQCLFAKTNESRLPWHDITSSDTFLNDLDDLVEKFVTDITVVSREESLQKKLHFMRHSSPQFGNNIGIILSLFTFLTTFQLTQRLFMQQVDRQLILF